MRCANHYPILIWWSTGACCCWHLISQIRQGAAQPNHISQPFLFPTMLCCSPSRILVHYPNYLQFYAGKGLDNNNYRAAIAGAVSGAFHVRTMAEQYGVPVILHTDHCAKKLLPWIDGLLSASERYYKDHGEPLFSSHMIDLSEEPIEENLEICKEYLTRMSKIGILLEMELGITGGEEDGVDNSDRPADELYSKPEEIYQVYEELTPISPMYTVAAAFGNVHGVYSPGNVRLEPEILNRAQHYISEKLGDKAPSDKKPVYFVFHGGSGSDVSDIRKAIDYGVIKMNIDTDTQWSYWEGIKNFEAKYHDYLQAQIGNPEGPDKPNKKYYDVSAMVVVFKMHALLKLTLLSTS